MLDNGGKMKIPRNIRDVSDNLGVCCQILWDRLQRIRWDSDSLMIGDVGNCHCIPLTTYRRIKDFGELMTKFLGVLHLKRWLNGPFPFDVVRTWKKRE